MRLYQARHLGLQIVRRGVQLSIIALVFGLVWLSLYAHYRAARALSDLDPADGRREWILTVIDRQLADVEQLQAFLDGCKGTLWSMRVGGLDLTDPLAPAEMIAASKTIYIPLLLSALIPTVATLLLGRVYCSWICPAGLLLEVTGKLRKLLRFAEIPPPKVRFSHRNKYVLLIVGLIVVTVVGLPIFALVYPPAVLSRIAHAWVFGTTLTGMVLLIAVIAVFELLVSPRWWCRTMCPGGALYALLGWPRFLRVRVNAERCTGCGACGPVCEPGIDPVTQSYGIECDNCGVCIRHCPEQALSFTLGLPRRDHQSLPQGPAPRAPDRVERRKDRAAVTGAFFILGLLAIPAEAHHILGLPHYSYKENYPQAPTLEYPATSGPYDVLLTCYPGEPVPGEAANLAIYIKNRNTDTAYDQPITVRVLQTFTFGRNRVVLPATEVQPFEVPHKLSATFPADGEYVVELTMDVEGQPEVIPFMVIAGDPTATVSILLATGLGLAVFVIVIRAIKIKRARHARASAAAQPASC
ncbi:MAG: 4Fe-4S binding protein [bacterium]|nr:4Fe-4S binding protein [bacterium]